MRLTCLLLAAAVAGTAHAGEATTTVERFEGIARTDDGALVYREQHEVEYQDGLPLRSMTRYFDPAGRKIAELRSDYRGEPYAPSYSFLDAGGRVLESAGVVRDGIRLQNGAESRVLERQGSAQLVLGQGLHQLVRARLEELAGGQPLAVRFGIPARLDSYAFKIERAAARDPGVVSLRIGIDNWLLSLIAPSLEVEYERSTRRLLEYRGVSNLPGPGGDTLKVRIIYRYDQPGAVGAVASGEDR